MCCLAIKELNIAYTDELKGTFLYHFQDQKNNKKALDNDKKLIEKLYKELGDNEDIQKYHFDTINAIEEFINLIRAGKSNIILEYLKAIKEGKVTVIDDENDN